MKNLINIFLLFPLLLIGQSKHVTVNGAGTHDGTSEANAWSRAEMLSNITSCKPCYLKAGNYGTTGISITASGTAGSPIQLIGYLTTPGDLNATNGSTFVYGVDTYSASDYPTLEGVRTSNLVSGTGFQSTGAYFELHNFQVRDFENGVIISGANSVANNVIVNRTGDINSSYSGQGLTVTGSFSLVENCFILNPGAEGLRVYGGSNQTHRYNWVGSDDDTDSYATDYYYLITSGSGNSFENCTVYRAPGQSHQGHGFVIKGLGTNNLFSTCTVINTNFEIQRASGNTITSSFVQNEVANTAYNKLAHVMFANAANNNLVEKTTFTNGGGIRFQDWHETGEGAGYDNIIKDCLFQDVRFAIAWPWLWAPGAAGVNTFDSCTFDGVQDEFFRTERQMGLTTLRNCVVSNSTGVYNREVSAEPYYTYVPGQFTLTVAWVNSHFFNNSWVTPSGTNITTGDPLYVSSTDFNIQTASPLKNTGSVSTVSTSDIIGFLRDATPDIGAYEFQGSDATPPAVISINYITIEKTFFRTEWNLDEGSKAQIIYDIDTGTVEGDYPFATTLEPSFLTYHAQTVGNNPSGVNPFLTPGTTYYWRIKVEDATGNAALSAEQTTTTIASNIPVITLTGENPIQIIEGGTYTELGAVWTDVEDGTGAATVGGDTVDPNTAGTYIVTYNFTDIDTNPAVEVTRTVEVLPAPVYLSPKKLFVTTGIRFYYLNGVKKAL